ncbi:uncharacterized protein UTRI_05332 [Ustilago trichophora]|uniref:Impact N-terminal domain-containing protein n=1 Tax=Ustilago trichophora TaxID=86804 RepID=A0A5C3EKU7_9BASI|nr:uncharacterized protein UTRI_05332 [Ustilago trichophora]
MSQRRKEQSIAVNDADLDQDTLEDDTFDDELARELEEERQAILAASANGHVASQHSENEDSSSRVEQGDANSNLDEDEDDLNPEDIPDQDDSEDEWQPPEPASSRSTRRSKRQRRQASSEDSDDHGGQAYSDDEVEPAPKKSKKTAFKSATVSKEKRRSGKDKTPAEQASTEDGVHDEEDEQHDSFDEEAERAQAEVEAAAAWADVRRRKEAASNPAAPATSAPSSAKPSQQPSSSSAAAPPSLTAWLGKPPTAASSTSELSSSLPMPTTCTAAQITDRSSLFIGYVYPLLTTSSAYISALLSHLTRVVHPTVPVTLLPPQFANAPSSKRGASHDMYAYRVLELKRGRTGLSGPDDFSLQEEKEDDGERWGGDRVLRVARDEGASDVLVVVSRWYGGELLGPARFDHIENAARAALQEHMQKMEVEEFRLRIQHLDRKIDLFKAKLQGREEATVEDKVNAYEDLTIDKGQRLWLARQKALDALQKRVASQSSQLEASEPQEAVAAAEPTASPLEASAPTPTPSPPPLAPSDVEPAPANKPAVKAEPSKASIPDAVLEDPSDATVTIKPESTSPTFTSPADLTIRVKAEPEPIFLLNHRIQDEPQDEKSKVVKLESTQENIDGDGEDLTGWDDLS